MVNVISTYGSGQQAYTIVFLTPGIPADAEIERWGGKSERKLGDGTKKFYVIQRTD